MYSVTHEHSNEQITLLERRVCDFHDLDHRQQTTAFVLSECDSVVRPDRPRSEDISIRYHQRAATQQEPESTREFAEVKVSPSSSMANWRTLSFLVGVCYSIISLAIAAASLGYEDDVQNSDFGFRAVLKGTALLSTVTFIASLGLIYGIMERRTGFVSAWLVLHVVIPLYTTAFYLWAIFASGDKTVFGPVHTAVHMSAIFAAIHVIVLIGCAFVVNHYYAFLKLRESLKTKRNDYETL